MWLPCYHKMVWNLHNVIVLELIFKQEKSKNQEHCLNLIKP